MPRACFASFIARFVSFLTTETLVVFLCSGRNNTGTLRGSLEGFAEEAAKAAAETVGSLFAMNPPCGSPLRRFMSDPSVCAGFRWMCFCSCLTVSTALSRT